MTAHSETELINWEAYAAARQAIGSDFVRILGYFREDGYKAVEQIEDAMRRDCATDLVMPAHKLKGEAAQLGAARLSESAEMIEMVARDCVERHEEPDELVARVAALRKLFERSLYALEAETSPLISRGGGFGKRAGGITPLFGNH